MLKLTQSICIPQTDMTYQHLHIYSALFLSYDYHHVRWTGGNMGTFVYLYSITMFSTEHYKLSYFSKLLNVHPKTCASTITLQSHIERSYLPPSRIILATLAFLWMLKLYSSADLLYTYSSAEQHCVSQKIINILRWFNFGKNHASDSK